MLWGIVAYPGTGMLKIATKDGGNVDPVDLPDVIRKVSVPVSFGGGILMDHCYRFAVFC